MAGTGVSKTGTKRLTTAEKQRRALELRKAGVGFSSIAEQLGYTHASGAHKAVMNALHRTIQEPADELRAMELERLDRMQAGLWTRVQQGHLGAIDRALRIMQRRATLLGLDAPKEQRLTGPDGGPIQHEHALLDEAVRRIAAQEGLDEAEVVAQAQAILAEGAE